MGLNYAGEISATEAWDLLSKDENSTLVDVRTETEWQLTGVANLDSAKKQPLLLSWRVYPNYDINSNFLIQFGEFGVPKDAKILLMCKVGGRSREAAMALTAAGYKNCFNVEYGMEGMPGKNNGWRAAGLPLKNYS